MASSYVCPGCQVGLRGVARWRHHIAENACGQVSEGWWDLRGTHESRDGVIVEVTELSAVKKSESESE